MSLMDVSLLRGGRLDREPGRGLYANRGLDDVPADFAADVPGICVLPELRGTPGAARAFTERMRQDKRNNGNDQQASDARRQFKQIWSTERIQGADGPESNRAHFEVG